LWEVYWNLVAEHGFNPDLDDAWNTGGNNLAVQLVMDGMKFQPCRPGFEDGRDAILAADRALTGGENSCAIWRGFAKRGLGYSARQGSSGSRSDGVQAFDLHPDCQAQAGVSPTSIAATVSEGGTTTETLRIANLAQRGGQTLGWSIAEAPSSCAAPADVAWLAVSPSSGDTAPGRSTEVDVRLAAGGAPAGSRSTGRICVLSNDAGSSSIAIPVSLEVTG
ncbi:MAG TPA: M36 family metallopeptidase, partial [Actinomycetota bacterium]|nr:M36 family metallopeptidase [Actinomycetota bacterium]